MEEEEARLALLQAELNSIQSSIRNMDPIILQIKGWCVTVALAAAGFAITAHKPALLLVGEVAIVGFFAINCQFRMFQRGWMERNLDIDTELRKTGIMEVLKGNSTFQVVGTGSNGRRKRDPDMHIWDEVRADLPGYWYEVRRASNFSIYAFLGACLLVELIVQIA